jgi:hypothetical protein
LQEGERWFPVEEGGRLTPERYDALRDVPGEGRVFGRKVQGRLEMKLATLPELQERFEEPGRFLLMAGAEITDAWESKPVHVNALNLAEAIPPQGGASVLETIQRNVDAVRAQGERLGRPVLAHVNHPNFGWGIGVEELARVRGERFFEVYNGHPDVRTAGDAEHPSTEEMWDRALALRLGELDLPPLFGLATDDSHAYHGEAADRACPGRGWIVVRAPVLTAESLLDAMHAGDFYASTGVELEGFEQADGEYSVRVREREGVRTMTRFVGTRRGPDGLGPVGEVLLETDANPAVYRSAGDELYVRAVVTSDRPHATGGHESAWLQPWVP